MNRRVPTICGFCLLGLLSSCGLLDPSGETLVEGQVVDFHTRQPVPNATLYVAGTGNLNGTVAGQMQPGTYSADAQGKFSFRFKGKELTQYQLMADAPPGYFTPSDAPVWIKGGRRNKDLTVPMLAPAWVRIHFIDAPPQSRAFIRTWGYTGEGDVMAYPRGDTAIVRHVIAGGSTYIGFNATNRTGTRTDQHQTITSPAMDTVDISFFY